MIDDPELLQLTNAATELITLQALAAWLQNHRDMSDDLDTLVDTFNVLQHRLAEAMSRRIVELALLHHDMMEPPSFEKEAGTEWMNPDVHHD